MERFCWGSAKAWGVSRTPSGPSTVFGRQFVEDSFHMVMELLILGYVISLKGQDYSVGIGLAAAFGYQKRLNTVSFSFHSC